MIRIAVYEEVNHKIYMLIREIVKTLKCKIGKIDRHMVSINGSKVRT
jgi:hypothetical protein